MSAEIVEFQSYRPPILPEGFTQVMLGNDFLVVTPLTIAEVIQLLNRQGFLLDQEETEFHPEFFTLFRCRDGDYILFAFPKKAGNGESYSYTATPFTMPPEVEAFLWEQQIEQGST
jgi:hypothetical protein